MSKQRLFRNGLLFAILLITAGANAQRSVVKFNRDWRFYLGDDSSAFNPGYNTSKWRKLDLPHDWSIEGAFSKEYPTTDNQAALPAGIGWYRKTFTVPVSSKDKRVFINFDGVYRNSEVWINGHFLGKRPNGYISFQYELTPYLKFGSETNVVSVRVDNSQQPNSRWYTGSGIYRNVWLETKSRLSIDEQTVFVHTSGVSNAKAQLKISLQTTALCDKDESYQLVCHVFDATGHLVREIRNPRKYRSSDFVPGSFSTTILKPRLWSTNSPYLYKVVIKLVQNGKMIDRYETALGIRYFSFDAQKGFSLNGKPMKILGVCMHHDLGALGAAVNTRAIERQLRILKNMGCNAVRTSHNPPAPEFLDLCDKLGFIVMDEAFDIWKKGKNKFDYHVDFDRWHRQDLEDQVKRDRNHPSVFIWSIGNEIREQFDSSGTTIAKELVQIVKSLDSTRPVTCALTENDPEKNFIYQSHSLDVLGFNYKLNDYPALPKRFPGEKIFASETASALETRGYYEMPSDSLRIWPPDAKSKSYGNADQTASAYDNTFAYWGATHERSWNAVKNNDYLAGTFVWCGFDFLGEPVPYQWPARSSYYGIVDLAGFPKDVYYMYQSEWTSKPVLHVFPHWNWNKGDSVDVWAYYNNADEVELLLNGRSLGSKRKQGDSLHVWWRVKYEAGTVKAISKKNGKVVLTREIGTAGAPAKLQLVADRILLKATGEDLCFVTVKVTDADGNLVPDADNLVRFRVRGEGLIAGVDNGLQTSMEPFKASYRKAFNGMCLVILKTTTRKGAIQLTAIADGLKSKTITVRTQ